MPCSDRSFGVLNDEGFRLELQYSAIGGNNI